MGAGRQTDQGKVCECDIIVTCTISSRKYAPPPPPLFAYNFEAKVERAVFQCLNSTASLVKAYDQHSEDPGLRPGMLFFLKQSSLCDIMISKVETKMGYIV